MNRKTQFSLAALAAALIAAPAASAQYVVPEELSISATFGWESAYVFRGVQLGEETFHPAIDVSYDAGFASIYGGVWTALPLDDAEGEAFGDEVDVYAGAAFGVSDLITVDVGFTYYIYPNAEENFYDAPDNTFEIFTGVAFEVFLAPAIYAYYDFDLENFTLEASGGYSVDVYEGASIDLGAFLGWVSLGDGNEVLSEFTPGMDDNPDTTDVDESTPDVSETEDSYIYYGVSADFSYAFTDNAAFSIGVRFTGSSEAQIGDYDDRRTFGVTGDPDDLEETALYFGWAFTAGF